jgi:hypothetical protein
VMPVVVKKGEASSLAGSIIIISSLRIRNF